MKTLILLLASLCMANIVWAQNESSSYDQELADSLGADDYGMKLYTLVMLKTGKVVIEDKKVVDSLFRGHMNNIGRLAETGQLIVAGPLMKNEKTYRGIFILTVKEVEEAKKLLATDPAISEGLLDYELYGWYGAAALPVYLETQSKITKINP
ncbi:hypothetical protein JKA74_19085 [Marivirga sp. S37H4]|uniref:YCII-related domain-containing protein n=1 Tax=Marivirga aurantiaca TaxID=2802615 RepID=A0A934X2B3_9BACT|nr:hypothetical protein [Marivirga aurantiaca]MBK6267157.1 hypothetical protein [Marivirga aurantiaca]